MTIRISADRERCIGSGLCVLSEDGVFDQDDQDGRVLLLTDRPADHQAQAVRGAVESCPGHALTLIEDPAGHQ